MSASTRAHACNEVHFHLERFVNQSRGAVENCPEDVVSEIRYLLAALVSVQQGMLAANLADMREHFKLITPAVLDFKEIVGALPRSVIRGGETRRLSSGVTPDQFRNALLEAISRRNLDQLERIATEYKAEEIILKHENADKPAASNRGKPGKPANNPRVGKRIAELYLNKTWKEIAAIINAEFPRARNPWTADAVRAEWGKLNSKK